MVGFSRLLSTISKKIVKPFSPTPSTQRIHKLSLLDQCMGNFYIPIVLFYPKHQLQQGPKQLSKLLENSFSKAISYHQPWVGSLRDNGTINCDGTGAEFFEVEVNCPMDQVVHRPDLAFPPGLPWRNVASGCLSVAQLSHFECGGIAISVCLSHKVGDASSAFFFMKDWAALTRQYPNGELACPPYYVQDSLMPSRPDGPLDFPVIVEPTTQKNNKIEKRFFFSESNIRNLKALVTSDQSSTMQNPTRTEVVSALVYKCAEIASANISSSNDSSSQLVLVSDLRKTIPPPIPSTSTIGNILTAFSTPIYNLGDLTLPKLVADIRKSKLELSNKDNFKENVWVSEMLEYANKINTGIEGDDQSYLQKSSCHDVYRCSSICNTPYQELDFGWGRPSRASLASSPFSNVLYLMNTHDQSKGIEVFINLNEQQMCILEQDKDFLKYATPIDDDHVHEEEEKYCIGAY